MRLVLMLMVLKCQLNSFADDPNAALTTISSQYCDGCNHKLSIWCFSNARKMVLEVNATTILQGFSCFSPSPRRRWMCFFFEPLETWQVKTFLVLNSLPKNFVTHFAMVENQVISHCDVMDATKSFLSKPYHRMALLLKLSQFATNPKSTVVAT